MSNATILTSISTQLTGLATQLTTLDGLSDPAAVSAQKLVVLAAGEVIRKNCAMCLDALREQRRATARTAIGALFADPAHLTRDSNRLEDYATGVVALSAYDGFFHTGFNSSRGLGGF